MTGLVIEHAALEDLPELVGLFDSYRVFYGQRSALTQCEAFLQDRFQAADSAILLARRQQQLLGFTQLYPLWSSVSLSRVWLLNDLFVASENRGTGVARRLMQAATELVRDDGGTAIRLSTELSNVGAQALYQALGYERDGRFAYYQLQIEEQPGRHLETGGR